MQLWVTHQEKPRKSPKGKKCKGLVSSRQAHWETKWRTADIQNSFDRKLTYLGKWMWVKIIRNVFLRPFCTRLYIDLKKYFTSSDYSAWELNDCWDEDFTRILNSNVMLKSIMSKKQRIGVQEVWSGSVVQSCESNVKNITFLQSV